MQIQWPFSVANDRRCVAHESPVAEAGFIVGRLLRGMNAPAPSDPFDSGREGGLRSGQAPKRPQRTKGNRRSIRLRSLPSPQRRGPVAGDPDHATFAQDDKLYIARDDKIVVSVQLSVISF
jgi:hypothetical protein